MSIRIALLVAMLSFTITTTFHTNATSDAMPNLCANTKYGNVTSNFIKERRVIVNGEHRIIVLKWSTEPELAAASLLKAALWLAGYRSTTITKDDRSVFDIPHSERNNSQILVKLAQRWTPGKVWNPWLKAVGTSAVPVVPRLHWRRTSHFCAPTSDQQTKLYITREWINGTQFKESIEANQFKELIEVDRIELLNHIDNDNESFAFFDIELWNDKPNVEVMGDVPYMSTSGLRVTEEKLWFYSPSLFHLVSNFTPPIKDLRHLLTFTSMREDPILAVCNWVSNSTDHLNRLRDWTKYVDATGYYHHVYVFLCKPGTGPESNAVDDYIYILQKFQKSMKDYHVVFDRKFVNCNKEEAPNIEIIGDLINSLRFYRTIGVIGPGKVLGELTSYTEKKNLALMAYSPVSNQNVGTTIGRPKTLVRALEELFAANRWRRIAVLSERDHIATDLYENLKSVNGLILKEKLIDTNLTVIEDALKELRDSDARIFLVNARARLAAKVMRVASELEMTSLSEYVWLVREWVASNNTVKVTPYELTFAWRGGGDQVGGPAWYMLKDRWMSHEAWPLYAAPLADAIYALVNGFKNIFENNQTFEDDIHSRDAFSKFWNHIETTAISSGVIQELRFKDRELRSPLVFIYRWDGNLTALICAWRVGEGTTCSLKTPDDGSVHCVMFLGNPFDQRCPDTWLVVIMALFTAIIPLLLVTATEARRAFQARDADLVKRAEEMLEAQWRAKASRLEPYFVERRALKLHEEIGVGHFGRVWRGVLSELATGDHEPGVVAAKALRKDAKLVEETAFFREASALAALQHEYIVRFIGVCVTDGPPLLLMEYALFGDLLRYLRARRHLTASDSPEAAEVSAEALTRFARQAAAALSYLARRNFVHRDVRAANCLVDERRTLKLADFGMARATDNGTDGDGEYFSLRGLFPVLWMAPESLILGVFSASSDVWALGVLMLELVTLGARPYGALSPQHVMRLVTEGGRPPLPRELSTEARNALQACWRWAPVERPTAAGLSKWFTEHPRALEPVLRVSTEDRAEDVDSGISNPPPGPSPPHSLGSF